MCLETASWASRSSPACSYNWTPRFNPLTLLSFSKNLTLTKTTLSVSTSSNEWSLTLITQESPITTCSTNCAPKSSSKSLLTPSSPMTSASIRFLPDSTSLAISSSIWQSSKGSSYQLMTSCSKKRCSTSLKNLTQIKTGEYPLRSSKISLSRKPKLTGLTLKGKSTLAGPQSKWTRPATRCSTNCANKCISTTWTSPKSWSNMTLTNQGRWITKNSADS